MKERKPLPDYAKYSALGLQMGAFIILCTFGGRYIDKFKLVEFPLFTILGLILGVFGAMYYMIKQISKK
ncbi:MAG: AtpZ/AtpI family protein [Bacteroidia bacterium]|nr:AtpZ/AtpI family protein [Bacteroidia bacterium]